MKTSKLLIATISLFAMLVLYACAPVPHGGHGVAGVIEHIATPAPK